METKRLLLVDDHPSFRQALAYLLEEVADIEAVRHAGSIAEARACLNAGKLDVAVVDLILPDGDGVELVHELAEAIPVLVLTIHLDPVQHARALAAGAGEVLTKDTSLEEIAGAIKRLGERVDAP